MKRYCCDEDDCERVIANIDSDAEVPPDLRGELKAVTPTYPQREEIIEHELRRKGVVMRDGFLIGKNEKNRDETIKSAIRHRLVQDALQRISAE